MNPRANNQILDISYRKFPGILLSKHVRHNECREIDAGVDQLNRRETQGNPERIGKKSRRDQYVAAIVNSKLLLLDNISGHTNSNKAFE